MTEKSVVTTEAVSFRIVPFAKWTGELINSSKRGVYFDEKVDDKGNKSRKMIRVDIQLPVPTTDEDAKKFYNLTLNQLIAKGVNQASHDETILSPILKAQGENITDEFLAQFTKDCETAHFRTERETKVTETKKNASAIEEFKRLFKLPPTATIEEVMAEAAKRTKK